MRHGDLSHEMTLSQEGRRPECDNVNPTIDLLSLRLALKKL